MYIRTAAIILLAVLPLAACVTPQSQVPMVGERVLPRQAQAVPARPVAETRPAPTRTTVSAPSSRAPLTIREVEPYRDTEARRQPVRVNLYD